MYFNLKQELKASQITQNQLSELLGVRGATISDKINGKSKFTVDEAFRIKKAFFPKYDLEYLFTFSQTY
ncbi:DNA-binding protein [Peptostreptococcus sp. MV1]|uniref:helix-turn-helix transcriptional regulator n=1 Tax=Peptostreptococcus sp. MV1 TaxID=1219626 RepID=UPI00050F695B|nr:helix-turn-helix transcriptional regulator [Peptostreptococcus sp. MV1]KGF11526.1 DNA-binding protein [Peptostreptococcus sp. MV1]